MYNFEQVVASSRLEILEAELDGLATYLASMEGFLQPEIEKRREQVAGIVDELNRRIRDRIDAGESIGMRSSADKSAEELLATTEWRQINHFAQILRRSSLLSLYAFLESRLDEECRYEGRRQKERGDVLVTLGDIAGTGIIRARTYWTKVLRRNFPDDTQWQMIRDSYRILRNNIVHSGGRLDNARNDEDAWKLREFVNNRRSLSMSADAIILHQDFNMEVLDGIRGFFGTLLRVWAAKCASHNTTIKPTRTRWPVVRRRAWRPVGRCRSHGTGSLSPTVRPE